MSSPSYSDYEPENPFLRNKRRYKNILMIRNATISQVAFVRNIVMNLLLHFRKELVEESRSTSKVSNSKKVKSRKGVV